MIDDIDLPPLPYPQIPGNDYDALDMWDYAREAIEADRQQRGEPVAYFQNSNSTNGKPPQYEQVCASSKNDPDVFPLYAASKPSGTAQEPGDSEIMWEWANTPNTGDMRVDLSVFARTLLARYGQPVEPEGWQLAPVGPTSKQIVMMAWPNQGS